MTLQSLHFPAQSVNPLYHADFEIWASFKKSHKISNYAYFAWEKMLHSARYRSLRSGEALTESSFHFLRSDMAVNKSFPTRTVSSSMIDLRVTWGRPMRFGAFGRGYHFLAGLLCFHTWPASLSRRWRTTIVMRERLPYICWIVCCCVVDTA